MEDYARHTASHGAETRVSKEMLNALLRGQEGRKASHAGMMARLRGQGMHSCLTRGKVGIWRRTRRRCSSTLLLWPRISSTLWNTTRMGPSAVMCT
jgi:hypothetical protein